MLHGEGVWNLTVMFLQMWAVITHTRSHLPAYGPYIYHPEEFENDGFVQPYGDSPRDNEIVGENVYLNSIKMWIRDRLTGLAKIFHTSFTMAANVTCALLLLFAWKKMCIRDSLW